MRVTRPGLTVRARGAATSTPKGKAPDATAASASGQPSAELREALDSPLPVSGLAMNVFAAPFKGTAPNASVLLGVEMRGRDLRLDADDKVDVSVLRRSTPRERFAAAAPTR